MSKKNVVIIGNGMVGHRFIEEMVKSPAYSQFHLTTFCEEEEVAYDRVGLSTYFAGKTREDLSLVEEGFYADNGVEIHIGDKATQIDRESKTVISEKGRQVQYDQLVLATGSFPFVPPIEGREQKHIHVYRTFEDLEAIKSSAAVSKSGVVLGGGLLGLECANALKNLGLEAHVVEFGPSLMGVQLDSDSGEMLRKKSKLWGYKSTQGKIQS